MSWVVYLLGLVLLIIVALAIWRGRDNRADQQAWMQLIQSAVTKRTTYDPAMVANLPEPARRYFNYTISPGTFLQSIVEIEMTGELGLGTKGKPDYRPMQAHQILAPPHGLVWKLRTGPVSGSDGALPDASWTRFWLFGLIPVARVKGPDHHRSAFGRVVAEAAFWAPASLLPGDHVRWEPLDDNRARAVVHYGEFKQAVDITVDESGAPIRVIIQRWSNENPEKVYREQPFGGDLSEFMDFYGYRLPTRVEGGNLIGTPDYFPFYQATVSGIRFPAESIQSN